MNDKDRIVLEAMKDFEKAETNGEKAACVRFLATHLAAAAALAAALEEVEWDEGGHCLWCYGWERIGGHSLDCQRQVALREYREVNDAD